MNLEKYTGEYVLEEVRKIKYLYGVNKVIRYNLERQEKYQSQSVAEHLTNMLYLAHYFRELEDPGGKLDFEKVIRIILFHDLGEIETGDIITVAKNSEHEDAERLAIQNVKKKSPEFVSREIEEIYNEFENPKTPEGKFAKAIDKLEGQIFWIEKEGVEMVEHIDKLAGLDINIAHPKLIKEIIKFLEENNFLIIKKFLEVINAQKETYGILKIN